MTTENTLTTLSRFEVGKMSAEELRPHQEAAAEKLVRDRLAKKSKSLSKETGTGANANLLDGIELAARRDALSHREAHRKAKELLAETPEISTVYTAVNWADDSVVLMRYTRRSFRMAYVYLTADDARRARNLGFL